MTGLLIALVVLQSLSLFLQMVHIGATAPTTRGQEAKS